MLYSKDSRATTAFYQIINEQIQAESEKIFVGVTTNQSYLPLDNSAFDKDINLVDWLRQWAKRKKKKRKSLRGFLGKMLFSGEEALKKCTVLLEEKRSDVRSVE